MRVACWVTNATHALAMGNTHCFSTATMVARTRHTVTLTHSVWLVYFSKTFAVRNTALIKNENP